jgi:hypothetical protein
MNKRHKFLVVLSLTLSFSLINSTGFGQTYGSNNAAGTDQKFPWPEAKKMAMISGIIQCTIPVRGISPGQGTRPWKNTPFRR